MAIGPFQVILVRSPKECRIRRLILISQLFHAVSRSIGCPKLQIGSHGLNNHPAVDRGNLQWMVFLYLQHMG